MTQNMTAVQRRHRNQIKYRQDDIDSHQFIEKHCDRYQDDELPIAEMPLSYVKGMNVTRFLPSGDTLATKKSTASGGQRDDDIADGASHGSQYVILDLVSEVRRIDRCRFSPSDCGKVRDHRDERHHNRSDRIDVHNRIQRDSAQHARGGIATAVCCPGVRRFVDADRKYETRSF